MQKTEKHCKKQCFCYHKTTKISPKIGPKTQKSASEPGHLRNRKKRCCKPKNWGQKVEKHVFFFTFRLPILDGRVHEQVLSVLFFTVFFEGERNDLSKTQGFGRKMPPPGKPVTFYECHPEDHAPAPSARADFKTGAIARKFAQEPSLDFPCSAHRSKIPVRLPQSVLFLMVFRRWVRTELSDCCLS